jgi:NRPS condensation-like uncharacterized protein
MTTKEIRACAFRILYYENRIALEIFHSLTDGAGALVFLKTLAAEYISLKYGVHIPRKNDIKDVNETYTDDETEDSYARYSKKGITSLPQAEKAYRLTGTKEKGGYINITTGILYSEQLHKTAKSYGVSITAFLCAVMIRSIIEIQQKKIRSEKKYKPVSILVPVDLRRLFGSSTLRNFFLCITPSIHPEEFDFSIGEIANEVYNQMKSQITKENMAEKILSMTQMADIPVFRPVPLVFKKLAIKVGFNMWGQGNSCISISNLGNVILPEEMESYVDKFEAITAQRADSPNNCAVISYGGKTYINIIRNIVEPELERLFFTKLADTGLKIKIESNQR